MTYKQQPTNTPLILLLGVSRVKTETCQDVAVVKNYPDITDSSILPEDECLRAVGIISGHILQINAALLNRCKNLRVVARLGIGVDNVDVEHASKLGVCVCNVPDYGIEEVADTAFALLLGLFRNTTALHEAVKRGEPLGTYDQLISSLVGCRRIRGKTLGLIGLGKIGIAVAERAKAFGFHTIFYDPFVPSGFGKAIGGLEQAGSIEEVVKRSDCVSLHCSLTPQTRYMINETILKLFKKEAFLVNVSRGGLIEEAALAKALSQGWIAGAALDVQEHEPFMLKGSALEGAPNLICTPHSAWYSEESFAELCSGGLQCVHYAVTHSDTSGLINCVNKQQLDMAACKQRWSK